ncbi:MAG: hypothetical protein QM661_09500 [Solimonas sp.]
MAEITAPAISRECSVQRLCRGLHAPETSLAEIAHGPREVLLLESGDEERAAVRAVLLRQHFLLLADRQCPPDRTLQGFEVELDLLLEGAVEHAADAEKSSIAFSIPAGLALLASSAAMSVSIFAC